jgi:hypothetical protein
MGVNRIQLVYSPHHTLTRPESSALTRMGRGASAPAGAEPRYESTSDPRSVMLAPCCPRSVVLVVAVQSRI